MYIEVHRSLPFYMKILSVLCCLYPHSQTFVLTYMQIISPIVIATFVIFVTHLLSLVSSHRNGKLYIEHVIQVITIMGVYANVLMTVTAHEPALAPLLSLLFSLHILEFIRDKLSKSGPTDNIQSQTLVYQKTICYVIVFAQYIILTTAWELFPICTAEKTHILVSTFVPELVGCCIRALFFVFSCVT
jgi:hypothetical protein